MLQLRRQPGIHVRLNKLNVPGTTERGLQQVQLAVPALFDVASGSKTNRWRYWLGEPPRRVAGANDVGLADDGHRLGLHNPGNGLLALVARAAATSQV